MSSSSQLPQNEGMPRAKDPPTPVLPAPVRFLIVAAIGFLYGLLTAHLPTVHSPSGNIYSLGDLAAPYLLIPFLAGAWQVRAGWASVAGAVGAAAAIAGFYNIRMVGNVRHYFLGGPFGGAPWLTIAVVVGLLFGFLGYRWRRKGSALAGTIMALAFILEPLVNLALTNLRYISHPVTIVLWSIEMLLGIAGLICIRRADRRSPSSDPEMAGQGSVQHPAQRRAAGGKRRMLAVGVPTGVVVLVVVLVIAANGGPQSKWKVSSEEDIKFSGDPLPRSTLVPNGEMLPAFSAPGLDGSTVSSAVGQPSVVAIWASWCLVCQEEMVILNRVKENYTGVKVISITTGQGQKSGPTAEQFVADQKIDIPVAVDDASQDLRIKMGVILWLPVLYFVNADGTVYKGKHGLLDEGELRTYFQTLHQQQAGQGYPTPTPTPTPTPGK